MNTLISVKPNALYHTALGSRNYRNSQITKKICDCTRLTLSETGTYTHLMNGRHVLAAALTGTAMVAIAAPLATAQTLQRSLYVSVVNEAGAPVPDLGPSDFIVREDNVAREILRVDPADEPMQIAVLVDTSQTARNNISYMRTALPPFVTALTNPNDAG